MKKIYFFKVEILGLLIKISIIKKKNSPDESCDENIKNDEPANFVGKAIIKLYFCIQHQFLKWNWNVLFFSYWSFFILLADEALGQNLDIEEVSNFKESTSSSEDSSDDDYSETSSDDSESSYDNTIWSSESSDNEELSNNSSIDENFIDNDLPLYPGAFLTTIESIIAIFTLMSRFNMPGFLLDSILSLIELHCIRPNNCLKSLYKFKKLFLEIESLLTRQYYCKLCFSKIESRCGKCNQDDQLDYFIYIPILDQLSSMFKRNDFFIN